MKPAVLSRFRWKKAECRNTLKSEVLNDGLFRTSLNADGPVLQCRFNDQATTDIFDYGAEEAY